MNSSARTRSLLRDRAITLAKRAAADDRTPVLDLLVVIVAGRRLGLDGAKVQQIVPNRGVCRLPGECGELLGLVTARGTAVPVADLGSLLAEAAPDRSRPFIVLLDGDAPIGLLVDEIIAVRRLRERDVRPNVATGLSVERGITPDGTVVLDAELLLADPRLVTTPDSHEYFLEPGRIAQRPPEENHAPYDYR